MIREAINRVARFAYDATTDSPKRRSRSVALLAEDQHLPAAKRRKLVAASRDLQRDYAIAGWMIRKHLDFVATHYLDVQTPDRGLKRDLVAMFDRAFREIDVQGRLDFLDMLRLLETRRMVDGDVLVLKLARGQLQAVESERLADPPRVADAGRWIHGVEVDRFNRARRFGVWKRQQRGGTLEYDRTVAAEFAYLFGAFDRFDQVRGVSPLAPAINMLLDSAEGYTLAAAKMKVANLFGLVLYRDAEESPAATEQLGADDADGDGDVDENDRPKYEVDFGAGPVLLDLDPGDKAEFLKNETNAPELDQFFRNLLAVAIKCLDLPYSFYDESFTNYSGSRAALLLYVKSATNKRRAVVRLLTWIHRWLMARWLASGELVFPRGFDPASLVLEWIPDALPWFDPQKELAADLAAIDGHLATRTETRRRRFGDDWLRVVERLAEEKRILAEAGLTSAAVATAPPTPAAAEADDTPDDGPDDESPANDEDEP